MSYPPTISWRVTNCEFRGAYDPELAGLWGVTLIENLTDMLGHLSIRHYSRFGAVTMCSVQTISREGTPSHPQRLHVKLLFNE